jgi:DNA repair protein RadB
MLSAYHQSKTDGELQLLIKIIILKKSLNLYSKQLLQKIMEIKRLKSGSDVVDTLLNGGFETDIITTIYGPAGVGKTTIAMMATISASKQGKKTIYIDTEGGFSPERFMQLCNNDAEIVKNLLFLKPIDFKEQMKTIQNLAKQINDKIGLVIVDTISMLYRAEVGATKDIKQVNNELGLQISWLTEIARKHNIPVIVINQVYADFEVKDQVKMVGGDILKYSSKCLIELLAYRSCRKAILIKHRSIAEKKEVLFDIIYTGLKETKI